MEEQTKQVLQLRTPDYYTLLGILPQASTKEIEHRYRSLAKKWHPDRNAGPHATQTFALLNEVYGVLRDDRKRETYDCARLKTQCAEPMDVQMVQAITLADLLLGAVVHLDVDRARLCTVCCGNDSLGCTGCSGYGHVYGPTKLALELVKGVVGGTTLQYTGLGNHYRAHQVAGNLLLLIQELPDALFVRKGADLHMDRVVSAADFTQGLNLDFRHPNGNRYTSYLSAHSFTYAKPILLGSQLGCHLVGASQPGELYVHLRIADTFGAVGHCARDVAALARTPSSDATTSPTTVSASNTWKSTALVGRAPRTRSPRGPSCYISNVARPLGRCQEHIYEYGSRYTWSCCGSKCKNPPNHC